MEKKDNFLELAKKMFPNPTQEVLETPKKVYIDGHPIDFISEVESEVFGKDIVKVTVTFFAKSFKSESMNEKPELSQELENIKSTLDSIDVNKESSADTLLSMSAKIINLSNKIKASRCQ